MRKPHKVCEMNAVCEISIHKDNLRVLAFWSQCSRSMRMSHATHTLSLGYIYMYIYVYVYPHPYISYIALLTFTLPDHIKFLSCKTYFISFFFSVFSPLDLTFFFATPLLYFKFSFYLPYSAFRRHSDTFSVSYLEDRTRLSLTLNSRATPRQISPVHHVNPLIDNISIFLLLSPFHSIWNRGGFWRRRGGGGVPGRERSEGEGRRHKPQVTVTHALANGAL